MVSVFGWYCLTHNMFPEDTDAVNDHIDSLPDLLSNHEITGTAHITNGDTFPPANAPSSFFPEG